MASTQQQAVKEQNLNLNPNNSYANLFKTPAASPNPTNSIKLKPISFFQGEPSITFDSTEVEAYIKEENLQYALILKFSHGYPDIHEMRKQFPLQFKIKGECNIGLLHPRHFLLRFSLVEDFVNIYSRSIESVLINDNGIGQEYEFRVQRWTATFNPKEETSIALAWISFPGLPCQMFARQAIYSLASAVGRPLHVDKATADKTRPSTARVKVEVNLLSKLPDRVRLCYRDVNSGEVSSEWQPVKYDKLPKYCATCKKQGHGDEDCRLNNQQEHQFDSADMVEKRKLDKFQGDLRNKLKDQRKKHVEGKVGLKEGGRNLQRNSLTISTAKVQEQEHTTNDVQIIDVPNGNVINPTSSPKGKEIQHEKDDEWEHVQCKKHGRRRSAIATEDHGEKNVSEGNNQWARGNCDSKESSPHMGKGQQNTTKLIGNHGDKNTQESSSNLNNFTPLSARTKIVEQGLSNILLCGEQEHMDYNTKVTPQGNTPTLAHHEETAKSAQTNNLSLKQLSLDGPTQRIQEKCNQKSGKSNQGVGNQTRNSSNTMDTHDMAPVLHHKKTNSASSNAQNVNVADLLDVGQCVSNIPNELSTDNAHKNGQSGSSEIPRDGSTQIQLFDVGACLENKTAITVPSQSDKLELEAERSVNDRTCIKQSDEHDPQSSYTSVYSPSHGSNVLIPTQELELLFKLERLMKLHGTNQVTLDIAKELTKQEHQIYLQMLRNSGYVCTSGATGTDEQATPLKERPPQQPKRVQPARSSKSNSTRGK